MATIIKNEKGMFLRRGYDKVQRNDPCPCESGRKFKNCCLNARQGKHGAKPRPWSKSKKYLT
jgi:hypothetical protein